MYSDKVVDHFHNPRNVGYFEDAEGMAQIGDPECGDYLLMFLRIREEMGVPLFRANERISSTIRKSEA